MVRSYPFGLRRMVQHYRAFQYVFMPKLIPVVVAKEFECQTKDAEWRRVNCGYRDVTWEEGTVPEESGLFQLFNSAPILESITSVSGLELGNGCKVVAWISRYRSGEYINPHKDGSGTIQLVLCLESIGGENGGLLALRHGAEYDLLRLAVGDAVLFRATAVEHYTTPPVASEEYPNPTRSVAVARYTLDEEGSSGISRDVHVP